MSLMTILGALMFMFGMVYFTSFIKRARRANAGSDTVMRESHRLLIGLSLFVMGFLAFGSGFIGTLTLTG